MFHVGSLAATVGFDLLGERLGGDVERAVSTALKAGAVFPGGGEALTIFQNTLAASIRNIEDDDRGRLFQRFLRDGPYEHEGPIPPELKGKRLTAEECATAITFVYAFMVNSFKGAVTELLAAGACQRLMQDARLAAMVPTGARLYVGDSVLVRRKSGKGGLKGAKLKIFIWEENPSNITDTEDHKLLVLKKKNDEIMDEIHKNKGSRHGSIETPHFSCTR